EAAVSRRRARTRSPLVARPSPPRPAPPWESDMNPTLRPRLPPATARTVLLACPEASPTTADLHPSVAVVHGQVTAEQGAPLPGAFVRVMVYQPTAADGCVADRPALAGTGYSDARGDFSIRG